jgi:alanyl-tRNA synthetase
MTPDELRQKYLNFFKERGHEIIPSSPLVPENDPTTLFVGSGMQPLLPYLLGQPHSKGTRLVNSQKAFRSQDIEEVGDNRHTTFFEMLGNWSLGDYFKKEQLEWIYEFFTKECGLPSTKLWISVYEGNEELGIPRDEEAALIWQGLGIEKDRIFYYGDKKNWWSRVGEPAKMPVGEPGGPDSEVFYDFGIELGLHEQSQWKNEECHPNCDCGRFMEIGNNVFMTYVKTENGYEELQKKNIDFGGGFERILAAINNDPDVFKTKLFQPIIQYLEKLSGQQYGQTEETTRAFRVIVDHMRASVMLAADGSFPSNKEQGYFVRRLVRRAIHQGRKVGINKPFLEELVPIIASIYQESYPELSKQLSIITDKLVEEEKKFSQTINKGLQELHTKNGGVPDSPEAAASEAFYFYQTWGLPVDIYLDVANKTFNNIETREKIVSLFNELKEKHSKESRTASAGMFKGGLQDHSETTVKYHTTTHLLHAALRKVLGDHAAQSGSNITVERLRFDFTHPQAVTPEELQQVEELVNEWIRQDLPVTQQILPKQQALDTGAIAFFIEKYPDEVSVYTIGKDANTDWISKEFCGGPHVSHTGEIGPVELFKEQSSGSGIRRVYARLR